MNIYVGNLSYQTTEEDLHELFAAFGELISANIITDRDSGRSKGFGFVEMENEPEGQAAMDALDGKNVDGRDIKVNQARPRKPRRSGGGGGGRGYGGGRSW